MSNILYIVRGISGSGKTTFAETLDCPVFAADDWMVNSRGEYTFNPDKLFFCHNSCINAIEEGMKSNTPKLAVANTFTREKEIQPYLDLARKYGYQAFSLIVENRHGGKNSHNVPDHVLAAQKNRFQIKLTS